MKKTLLCKKTVQSSSDEIRQLEQAVSKLREKLENQKFDFEAKIQKIEVEKTNEANHLRNTISDLRHKLENKN